MQHFIVAEKFSPQLSSHLPLLVCDEMTDDAVDDLNAENVEMR